MLAAVSLFEVLLQSSYGAATRSTGDCPRVATYEAGDCIRNFAIAKVAGNMQNVYSVNARWIWSSKPGLFKVKTSKKLSYGRLDLDFEGPSLRGGSGLRDSP